MEPSSQIADISMLRRRTFLKTSALSIGGASLLSQGIALASGSITPPCPIAVSASPDQSAYYSPVLHGDDWALKIKVVTTPAGGAANEKKLVLQIESWQSGDYAGTNRFSDPVEVTGKINHGDPHSAANCKFTGTVDVPGIGELGHYMGESDPHDRIEHSNGTVEELSWTYSATLKIVDSKVIDDVEAYIIAEATMSKELTSTIYDPSSGVSSSTSGFTTFVGARVKEIRAWKS